MKRYLSAISIVVVAGIVLCLSGFSFGADQAPGNEQDVAGALVDLLKDKGLLTPEDVSRFHKGYRKEAPDQGIAALVDLLKSKKVISEDEATQLTRKYGTTATVEKAPTLAPEERDKAFINKVTADVTQEVKEDVHEQIKTEVQEEVAKEVKKAEMTEAAADWTKRIRFGGDIRLRYEHDDFNPNNAALAQPSNPSELMNTTANQNLFKYRVRLEMDAQVIDQLGVVVRLTTGSSSNPVSTNATWGNFFDKDTVVFDFAYVWWEPSTMLALYGGRMPNPFFNSADLLWARDLSFEGLDMNLHMKEPMPESWIPFLNVGAFPLQINSFASQVKWLVAGQLGVEEQSQKGIGTKLGVAYYYFNKYMTGIPNNPDDPGATDWTAPYFQQKGNTLFNINASIPNSSTLTAYASEFHELNLSGSVDIGLWDPYHILLIGSYVKNLGFDESEVYQLSGSTYQATTGYQFGISAGNLPIQWRADTDPTVARFGQWRAYFNYKYLGADAVVDAFTDPDFHLGGTNAKGWILGTFFGLSKNIWLTLRWLTANQIAGPPLAIDVLQFDFNAAF